MKILVDTCVWVDFFRGRPNTKKLSEELKQDRVIVHPWIILELILGYLGKKGPQILNDLDLLCSLDVSPQEELRSFIIQEKLSGAGLSLADTEILYSCLINDLLLWTHDKNLQKMARVYDCLY